MSNIIRFGIDLAKTSFAICGVDEHGNVVLRKTLTRAALLEFFANVPPALVAMEAGSGAHHWARELIMLGHDARIMIHASSPPTGSRPDWQERPQRCRGHV